MSQVNGICDFLNQAGTQYKIFDMGRRIEEINQADFLRFEQGEIPYPLPLQQQAWLGFLVWTEDKKSELVIWFLRFPLDAAGKLTTGIRDDFVLQLINKEGKDTPEQDEENPYGFKPKQEHMACFHAKAAKLLNQPASSYYEHTRDYFIGKPGYDQWAFVGFQGIADLATRLDEDNNAELVAESIEKIPHQPFEALAQCLEHEKINTDISQSIVNIINHELEKDESDATFISLCIRALSNTQDQTLLELSLSKILKTEAGRHPEVLASISGRCWLALKNEETINLFLEALAHCSEGQNFFTPVIIDLINIPGMQESILKAVKSPERSEKLSVAIGELFKSFT
ncbi:MAG: hypothetical protein DIZ80_15315 [endosymbiont of Galathealinum brachiosum]|uniref:DUF3549 domain-containing protein n=1 Tax=endosymbiont of Galathealinum brachiosum TaxID=2200906 RepID=A0A370D992_9GAMM|nr:MAG: hypothetical protein DIZ80_15315 [endosymbiont of Galathealinum brachiosum]